LDYSASSLGPAQDRQDHSDAGIAARLVEAAADLKDQAGELPPPVGAKLPDVQMEE
jgi:hypothetical protein